jgi:hypothetical protein
VRADTGLAGARVLKSRPFYNEPTPIKMSRDQLVTDWVASRFPDQSRQITPASADASFRRYFRLTWPDGSTRILMDAPPDKEDCKPFIHVAGLLAKAELAAPRVLDHDLDNGFPGPHRPRPHRLSRRAQRRPQPGRHADAPGARRWCSGSFRPRPAPATLRRHLLRRELDLFPEWFIGRHLGYQLSDDEKSCSTGPSSS